MIAIATVSLPLTLERILARTTAADDLAQRQSQQAAVEVAQLRQRFTNIFDTLEQNLQGDGIPIEAYQAFEVSRTAVLGALTAFDAKAGPAAIALFVTFEYLLIAWSAGIVIAGPERAAWGRAFGIGARQITLTLGEAISPTVTTSQLLKTFIYQFAAAFPGNLAFSAALANPTIYRTFTYTGCTAAASLVVVTAIVGFPEWKKRNHQRKIDVAKGLIATGEIPPALLDSFNRAGVDANRELQTILDEVDQIAARYQLGNATNGQVNTLRGVMNDLRNCVLLVTGSEPVQSNNADKPKKISIFALAFLLVAIQAGASARSPILLVDSLRWGAFFLYVIRTSVNKPTDKVRDTMKYFCELGAGTLTLIPTVSVPLLADGPEIFDSNTLLAISVALTTFLNISVAHYIAPGGMWLFDKVAPVMTNVRRLFSEDQPDHPIRLALRTDGEAGIHDGGGHGHTTAVEALSFTESRLIQRSSASVVEEMSEAPPEAGWEMLGDIMDASFRNAVIELVDDEEIAQLAYSL